MVTPEAAVEAALSEVDRALDGALAGGAADTIVRVILEAAAPHMLAEAWDEGYTTGNAHNGRRDANPYRQPQKLPHESISGDREGVA